MPHLVRGPRFVCVPLLAALLLTPLVACSRNAPDPDRATGQIVAYNHTPDYIHQLYIDGAYGGNSRAYGGGGKFTCCVVYPRQWRPDLTVTVRWTTSSSDPNATGEDAIGKWHEAQVPIEPYDNPGRFNVHFLPEGKVRVVISSMSAGHQDYPGPPAPVMPPDFPFQRR